MSTTTDRPRPRALPPLMTLSEAAAERLTALYARAEAGKLLHIGVKTKGCSGMAYDLTFVDKAGPSDERVTDRGITILVDRKATLFLIGTEMDYATTKLSSTFVFNNPNQKSACGCGESVNLLPAPKEKLEPV